MALPRRRQAPEWHFDRSQPYDNSMPPLLFKVYTDLAPTPLLLDRTPRSVPALDAIAVSSAVAETSQPVDLDTLTRIFYFSAGITKHLPYQPTGATISFRAAACTGALFHIELYLVCGDIPGLAAGVYHLDPQGPSIRQLRQGKYRHAFWDSGTILEQFGNRGYRAAQFNASIAAGRMYLAAYTQGFGATGLTFFDDAVTDFFSPHAQGKSVMFLISLGHKASRT